MIVISFDSYWLKKNNNFNEVLKHLLTKTILFDPQEIWIEDEYSYEDGYKILSEMDFSQNEEHSINVIGERNGISSGYSVFTGRFGNDYFLRLQIRVPLQSKDELEHYFVIPLIKIQGLLCCFINDYEDQVWQSRSSIDQYEFYGKPYAHLPQIKDGAGRTVIDVSGNWGRSFYYCNIMFVAAARMYFSDLFKFLSKDTLLSIDGAKEEKHGENTLIIINLFDLFNENKDEIRFKQKKFLEEAMLFETLENVRKNSVGYDQALKKFGY
jgi:hypothetical protein